MESLLDVERVECRPRAGPWKEQDRSEEPSFQRPTSASRAQGSSTGDRSKEPSFQRPTSASRARGSSTEARSKEPSFQRPTSDSRARGSSTGDRSKEPSFQRPTSASRARGSSTEDRSKEPSFQRPTSASRAWGSSTEDRSKEPSFQRPTSASRARGSSTGDRSKEPSFQRPTSASRARGSSTGDRSKEPSFQRPTSASRARGSSTEDRSKEPSFQRPTSASRARGSSTDDRSKEPPSSDPPQPPAPGGSSTGDRSKEPSFQRPTSASRARGSSTEDRSKEPSFQRPTSASRARGSSTGDRSKEPSFQRPTSASRARGSSTEDRSKEPSFQRPTSASRARGSSTEDRSKEPSFQRPPQPPAPGDPAPGSQDRSKEPSFRDPPQPPAPGAPAPMIAPREPCLPATPSSDSRARGSAPRIAPKSPPSSDPPQPLPRPGIQHGDRSKEPSFQRPTSASRARAPAPGWTQAVMSLTRTSAKKLWAQSTRPMCSTNEPPATIASTTFSKINVEGDPAMLRRARKDAPGTNHKMQQGKLKLVCIDHCTGTPVANVHIHVNTVENQEAGKMKNFSKALGSSSVTDHLGVAVCRLIAGRSYGTLGEHLTVSVCSDQVVERNLPMQPIRVTVVVHPLDKVPERPKESRIPAPQKVSFYTPAGTRMNFLATTSMQDQTLGVAVRPTADLVERYSTDSEGHCYFYGPLSLVPSTPCPLHPPHPTPAPTTPPEGHCYFYGPRVNGVQPNRMRNTDAPDSGAWWPTAKFHLRANPESGPPRGGNRAPGGAHHGNQDPEGIHNFLPQGDPEAETVRQEALTMGDQDPEGIHNFLPQGDPEAETVRQEALTMGDQDPEGIHNFLPQGEYLMSLIDPSRMLIFYTYTGDKEQAQITKAQDAIVPFTMHSMTASQLSNKFDTSPENKVKFPMQLYCRARPWFQDAIVPFTMHCMTAPQLSNKFDTSPENKVLIIDSVTLEEVGVPFSVLIIDSVTLEEVGVPFNVKFKIEKVAHHKCIPFRVAKLKAAITEQFKAGNPDPTDCQVYNQNMLDDVSSNDMMWNGTATLPFTSNAYEALEHDLYLPMKDGKALDSGGGLWAGSDIALTEDSRDAGSLRMEDGWAPPERTWLTPGDIYSVKVTMEEPFMEMTMRQTRMSNWELEPFGQHQRGLHRL
eukprot:gene30199-35182_t